MFTRDKALLACSSYGSTRVWVNPLWANTLPNHDQAHAAAAVFRRWFARSLYAELCAANTPAHRRHLSAMRRHVALLSRSRVNLAISSHSAACLINCSVGCIGRSPVSDGHPIQTVTKSFTRNVG
jgi:hypothetical protein